MPERNTQSRPLVSTNMCTGVNNTHIHTFQFSPKELLDVIAYVTIIILAGGMATGDGSAECPAPHTTF